MKFYHQENVSILTEYQKDCLISLIEKRLHEEDKCYCTFVTTGDTLVVGHTDNFGNIKIYVTKIEKEGWLKRDEKNSNSSGR